MHTRQNCSHANVAGRKVWFAVTALALSFAGTGCLSSLTKHNAALAAATAPVIDQAATAYQSADTLHDTWLDYDAAARFDNKQAVYNPESIQPLLTARGIEVRLTVLAAFKCYVRSLIEITNHVDSQQLDSASASVGGNLIAVANQVAPSIESTLGIAVASGLTTYKTVAVTSGNTTTTTSSTSTGPPPATFSPAVRSGVSTAANALGQYLVSRKIKKELPLRIKEMDHQLDILCKLMEDDIDVLRSQEKIDYENILDNQTVFLRATTTLQPEERREQIMKLPEIVRQHRALVQQLDELHESLVRLSLAHHALAIDAEVDHPESLKAKFDDLAAAGSSLGTFYSSQPAK